MNITVFGATGGTGRCVVSQAIAAGHHVTAVVRDPARLAIPEQLAVVTADPLDPTAIAPAVAKADAVISAIGPRGSGPTTVSHDSAAAIIAAMGDTGPRRLITISGSVVADDGNDLLLRLVKPVVRRTALRHVCADMRRAEGVVGASGLDWTIMRPPRLTDKPAAGRYRTALDRGLPREYAISRADLAGCILGLLDDQRTVHKHVAIAY